MIKAAVRDILILLSQRLGVDLTVQYSALGVHARATLQCEIARSSYVGSSQLLELLAKGHEVQ